jgi:hypothetical protein
VIAEDASGQTAPDYRGTVRFTSSDSHALLPSTYTFTATDGGIHIFRATLKRQYQFRQRALGHSRLRHQRRHRVQPSRAVVDRQFRHRSNHRQ